MPSFSSKTTFREVPPWLNIFSSKSVSINSPQLHYYTSRTQQDQPITLYCKTNQLQFIQMKMFYSIERDSPYTALAQKDVSDIKEYAVEQERNNTNQMFINRQNLKGESSWIVKYEPKRFIDLLSDELVNRNVLTWLKSWDQIVFKKKPKNQNIHTFFRKNNTKTFTNHYPQQQYNYKKFILLAGPPGCGKTTLARVLAKHSGYCCQEINASDDRSGKALILKIQNFLTNKTIKAHQKPVCLIIDEVDGALDSEANGMKNLLNYLQRESASAQTEKRQAKYKPQKQDKAYGKRQDDRQKHKKWGYENRQKFGNQQKIKQEQKRKIERPIIFICNDPFVKGLRQLRSKAIVVYMNPVTQERIIRRLKEISEQQEVYIDSQTLAHISKICGRDIRSSIGLLQLLVKTMKENGLTAKQIISRMKMNMAKDTTQNNSNFLLQVILKQYSQ